MKTARLSTSGASAFGLFAILLASLLVSACSRKQEEEGAAATGPAASTATTSSAATSTTPAAGSDAAATDAAPLPPLPFESALPEAVRAELRQPFTGDLDEMAKRRLVRVGVAYNRTLYFVDQGTQRGVANEYGKLMEEELNRRRKTGKLRIVFWFVPLPRDQLLSWNRRINSLIPCTKRWSILLTG